MCLMYWFAIAFVKFSDEKDGLLSVKRCFGHLYCKMSCRSSSCTDLAVLEAL